MPNYNSSYTGAQIDAGIAQANKIGNLASLTTSEKGSIVGAVNELDSKKANISAIESGAVEAAVAVLAKALKVVSDQSGAKQTAPFFFQATATANNTASTPTAPQFYLNALRGNTIVYNQLVNTGDTSVATISGHKYWTNISGVIAIVTADGTAISVADTDKVVDLTRWFNGSIPQAILDDVYAFPINYYDGELTYSAGELKNCSCTELKTVGFNALVTQPTVFDSIPAFDITKVTLVIPGDVYHLKYTATGNGRIIIVSYDLFGNVLGGKNVNSSSFYYNPNGYDMYNDNFNREDIITFIYPSYVMIFYITFTSLSDCNLNISWDGERDGEYEPYTSHTYPMVWSGKSAGSAYDERLPDGTEITRIGNFKFSQLSWSKITNAMGDFFKGTLANAQIKTDGSNFNVSAPYDVGNPYGSSVDNICYLYNDGANLSMLVRDSAYNDATAFSTAKANEEVNYELATPTTSSGDAYTSVIEGDDYGTMSFDSIVPVGNEFFYPADYALLVDDLYNLTNGDAGALMLKSENVVPSAPASDGTYTLKLTKSGDTKTYSWVGDS